MADERATGGLWNQPGVPHRGWAFLYMDDLDDAIHVCEMCRAARVRYVHYMRHPEHPKPLAVGCVCAGHMEQDYEGAREREKEFISRMQRRAKWLTRRWRESGKHNEFLNAYGFNVVVFPKSAGWAYRFQKRDDYETPPPHFSPRLYPTRDEAKLAAFDALEEMRATSVDD